MKRVYSLTAKEVPIIMKDTLKYSCGCFYVRYKDSTENIPKFAFIASKKEFKKAVQRNFVKRRLKECAASFLKDFPNKYYLFFIQKNAEAVDFKDLKKEVEKFVKSVK